MFKMKLYREIKILFVAYRTFPFVGGGTWPPYYIASSLARKGHKIQMLAPNIAYNEALPDKSIITSFTVTKTPRLSLPNKLASLVSAPFIFLKTLQMGKFSDIIICQVHPNQLLGITTYVASRILRRPIILRSCDVFRNLRIKSKIIRFIVKVFDLINSWAYKRADAFTVSARTHKMIIQDQYRIVPLLSPNGVNVAKFGQVSRLDARARLSLPPSESIILYVGRLGYEYGLERLLISLPCLLSNRPNVRVVFVGGGSEMGSLAELTRKLGISNKVTFLGWVSKSNIPLYIAACDVAIGPLEPTLCTPLKVLEYFAGGRPVVACKNSVSSDVAIDGVNCVLVDVKSESLALAIEFLLKNKYLSEKIGSSAATTARKYDWETISTNLETLIIQLLGQTSLVRSNLEVN